MTKRLNRGFTLIELLVVIAIIGILSSVVLASLNTARTKGANAAIKSNLNNTRAQAEIIYDNNNGSYALVCADVATIQKAMTAAASAAGSTAAINTTAATAGTGTTAGAVTNVVTCHSTAAGWAIESPLKAVDGTANFWCVDSTGTSSGYAAGTTLAANDVTCG